MVFDAVGIDSLNASGAVLTNELISKASNLIILFQAIGGLIIAYIIFNAIGLWQERKKRKDIQRIRESLERIERSLAKKRR